MRLDLISNDMKTLDIINKKNNYNLKSFGVKTKTECYAYLVAANVSAMDLNFKHSGSLK